jgi:hypothetical protein
MLFCYIWCPTRRPCRSTALSKRRYPKISHPDGSAEILFGAQDAVRQANWQDASAATTAEPEMRVKEFEIRSSVTAGESQGALRPAIVKISIMGYFCLLIHLHVDGKYSPIRHVVAWPTYSGVLHLFFTRIAIYSIAVRAINNWVTS